MSKMGNFVMDVQERYANGESAESIAKSTRTPVTMVTEIIEEFLNSYQNDYPEPEGDF